MTSIAVTAAGMACSLGLNSAQACAAARAGLVRVSEIDTFNYTLYPDIAKEGLDGVPLLVGHRVPVVGDGCAGLAKLLALSRPALNELFGSMALSAAQWSRTALLVNVSDAYFQCTFGAAPEPIDEREPLPYAAQWTRTVAQLSGRICAEFGLPLEGRLQFAWCGGRTGIAELLLRCEQLLEANEVDRCIIGAVESCLEPQALLAYSAAGVLKTEANPAGFLPGEAAVYLLVERASAARSRGAFVLGGIAQTTDTPYLGVDELPRGLGLVTCIDATLSGSGLRPGLVIADLNGTEMRANDWGHALVHLRARWGEFDFQTWMPAQSFGETGAASGAVALCVALRALERGYAPPGMILAILSAENGGRAALSLLPLAQART